MSQINKSINLYNYLLLGAFSIPPMYFLGTLYLSKMKIKSESIKDAKVKLPYTGTLSLKDQVEVLLLNLGLMK